MFLARYRGETVDPVDGVWTVPSGIWRCPEVPPSRDIELTTHRGILHHAPNGYLFNTVVENRRDGVLLVTAEVPDGWERRYPRRHAWRRLVTAPVGFERENIFFILRKPGGAQSAPVQRRPPAHLQPLPLEQVGVRGAALNWARRTGARLGRVLGMTVPSSTDGK